MNIPCRKNFHRITRTNISTRRSLEGKNTGNSEATTTWWDIKLYIDNIHTMEQLTRAQTNLELLKKHHAENLAAGKPGSIDIEVVEVRIGDFDADYVSGRTYRSDWTESSKSRLPCISQHSSPDTPTDISIMLRLQVSN